MMAAWILDERVHAALESLKHEHSRERLVRVLILGSGGREHALAWRLTADPHPHELYAAAGNPGIGALARLLPYDASDIPALLAAAEELSIELTVVGPEIPLAKGIVDAFRGRGLRIFGPTAAAARLESSKVFAKRLLQKYRIPTAPFEVFDRATDALPYVRQQARPLVIKVDGLAAGKGVIVTDDASQAEAAIRELMIQRVHGAAAERVVIEDRLHGFEISLLALVGAGSVAPLPPAMDYKRRFDGNEGPNTGGMGALAPAPVSPALINRILTQIVLPTVEAMAHEGYPYTGVLYAGIMVTDDGPKVLEFNCRFGDPEAQVLLPLLDGDFATAMVDVLEGSAVALRRRNGAAVCVVLAARGYPGSPELGQPISGLDTIGERAMVFHAGTARRNESLVTAGGRVLNIVGTAPTVAQAAARAYEAIRHVHFPGMQWRTDIGEPPMVAVSTSGAPVGGRQ